MTTYAEAMDFYEKTRLRELRRLLPDAVAPTGWDEELAPVVRDRLELGRRQLIQLADFTEAVQRPTLGDRA